MMYNHCSQCDESLRNNTYRPTFPEIFHCKKHNIKTLSTMVEALWNRTIFLLTIPTFNNKKT